MFKIEVLTKKGWLDTGFAYDDIAVTIIHADDLWQNQLLSKFTEFRVINSVDGSIIYTTEG